MFGSIPSNTPGHRRWTSHKPPLHVPAPLGSFHWSSMSREPVAGDGGRRGSCAASMHCCCARLQRGGRGSTRRLDDGRAPRVVSGWSKASPGRHQAGRCKLMPCGARGGFMMGPAGRVPRAACRLGRPRGVFAVPVWWPTQANIQGDGWPLGPQVFDGLRLLPARKSAKT